MTVAVLTACPGEGQLRPLPGVAVVQDCPDVEDLLVTAATGVADAVLLGIGLAGLDRDVLARLAALGLGVVGLVAPGDDLAERRLRQLGVQHVRSRDAEDLPAALTQAVARAVVVRAQGFAHAPTPAPRPVPTRSEPEPGAGRVVAVWGPTGAPGRTTVAVTLAHELALLGWPVLLVDADPYGGAVAAVLGLSDESSALATACRSANLGVLDTVALSGLVVPRAPRLSVLTGVAAQRWPELRPAGLEVVLTLARSLAAVTVVDCGFCLEQDEELSYDTLAPRRNGATLTALEHADLIVAVGTTGPVGLPRLTKGLDALQEVVPEASPVVVLNRLRDTDEEVEARVALAQAGPVGHVVVVPEDPSCPQVARTGLALAEAAPRAPARLALQAFAGSLATTPARG